MSQSNLRRDPLFGRTVLIAPERASRPIQTHSPTAPLHADASLTCPFCPGHEADTPDPVYCSVRDDRSSWDVRVVPNRFPAVRMPESGGGIDPAMEILVGPASLPLFGQHDVIIECPEHVRSLATLPARQVQAVLRAYRARCLQLRQDSRLRSATLFKNVGAMAGASLDHSHSQLITLPVVPPLLERKCLAFAEAGPEWGDSPLARMLEQEKRDGVRWIAETEHAACFAPYASRFAYEAWIVPKTPAAHFEDLGDVPLDEIGLLLHHLLRCLEECLGSPAFNWVIHTAPWHSGGFSRFHWHLELIPRLHQAAGFEWGTDLIINPTAPEEAAAVYRSHLRSNSGTVAPSTE
ncbi:galactose-1-phosphate uridylyltransferase [Tuwongella immobilis]|uniref:Galactose-1-phosphate uridyl transferase N-terminal domain-containing protein n=1 Tax=Tuwongella immobilis TaxID=692036 RepID=A0A6C2YL16_9BACT|nr:DUF4931 domain-containing protein [Tuwongella immobilis]VIP02270.1 galactose-1-phosphate uridylyltransferase : Galactose-1-phosphate uridylyltransferase, family 1 OS=Singulisphaera acidiphila (strain ATCC BAA-1392 / DSM 18658 / VKM B-2454 / MOB10) GN=Sinac_6565 PE=4 SV=1: GalP_UDP_transf [Tuwongella immobilis]VTS00896.1 galactose-1-phosphate uridylyltransferase : Galactose-1-phosphate uridylyltransferase, family 1 OS=Singulisphaera acidiphila (strain ATCC BAA-1392 / DSM 18658 / VKM B-2454 / MO